MAKKNKPAFRYKDAVAALKAEGPGRLYLLYGPEDYLRERYLEELKLICVPEGDDFSYKRLDGPNVDLNELAEAVNAMPFFSERTLVEVRDYDINKCRDAEADNLKEILGDLPDYCTVVFVVSSAYELDGRLTAAKLLKKLGNAIEFTEQEGSTLLPWIAGRFKALGKAVSREDAEYLIFLCGTRMNALIPEIEKAAAHAAGSAVTRQDIDLTANRIAEADVFQMTDLLGQRQTDRAAAMLSDLLADKENHPILLNALIGQQMRRLYTAKLGLEQGLRRDELMALCGAKFDFIYDKLVAAARGYSLPQLEKIVALCAEYDFKMKSTGLDADMLIREMFARISAGV